MSILGLVVLYPYGNIRAIDAYFFGASASTESGLNTRVLTSTYIFEALYIYFAPILTNLGFINIMVAVVRIHWFQKRCHDNLSDNQNGLEKR
ncbi:hypothetical protein N7488_008905 [Penicillium malachiteum]|nr:hypothetical protein N7488_008905 [Penicillium malachiteum]